MTDLNLRRLDAAGADFDADLARLLDRDTRVQLQVEQTVADIIAQIRQRGDAALLEYTSRLDGLRLTHATALEMPPARLTEALAALGAEQRAALQQAAERIRDYHERQRQSSWEYEEPDGTRLGQRITPLDRVGLYVPGGRASYPSSVLMNAIPAKVAGVAELIMVVPTPAGEVNDMVLAAAALAGVDRVFRIGGAQAIAALAYGTATVPAVDKIVGPGNIYVATAKKQVFGQVGIDMIAGPSEVVVVGDASVDPEWAAMDLFAQAEHDELAQAILISTDPLFLDQVQAAIAALLPTLERAAIIRQALTAHGALIQVRDLTAAAQVINRIAPEHLELLLAEPRTLLQQVRHAGAVFLGRYSAEAMGDYCAGPNHVLPTAGTARFSSPLGVYDFEKRTSLIECSSVGAAALARTAAVLARSEALTAHARAAEYRIRS